MYRLEAFDATDGWAIVTEGQQHYLLRPPYLLHERVIFSSDEVMRLLTDQRMAVRGDRFESLGGLVRQLEREREAWEADHLTADPLAAAAAVLEAAEPEDLDDLLDAVDQEWLKHGAWRTAEQALTALLTLPALRERPDLLPRLQALMQRCQKQRDRRPADAPRRKRWFRDMPMPPATDARAALIQSQRQVMPMSQAA